MDIKKGIGYSPLSEKIYLGIQNQEKGIWIGSKEDVTSDFISIMMDYIKSNTMRSVMTESGGDEHLFLNVKNNKDGIEKAIKWLNRQLNKDSK